MYRRLKLVAFIIFLFFKAEAQGEDTLFSIARFDKESFKIRWSCTAIDVLRAGINNGWQVQLFEEDRFQPVQVVMVQAKPLPDIGRFLFTPGDSAVLELYEEIRSGVPFFGDKNQFDWYRFAFLFGLQDNFALSKELGMAHEVFELDTSSRYRVEVEVTGGGNYYIASQMVSYQNPVILPEPEAPYFTCQDNRISMTGILSGSAGHYSSYYLEKMGFGVDSFVRVNQFPLVVNHAYGHAMINFMDSISQAGPVQYRLGGKDMWGDYGPYSEPVKVEPCHLQYVPPYPFLIRETEERGKLHLQWDIPDTLRHLLEGFNIYRSDDKFGEFILVNDGIIAPDIFNYIDNGPLKVGYYQIKAIYKGAIIRNSLTVPGILLDVVPPAIPDNLKAELDTGQMIVTITWDPVTDADLKGYRVSFAHQNQGPKFLLNNREISQPIIRDTLNRQGLHQEIYYWVTSRDFSQNESFYSDSFRIELPDRFPPAAPRITHVQPGNDFISIFYDRSASSDVQQHILQRRVKADPVNVTGWEEIPLIPMDWNNVYVDSSLSVYDTFEYRILAVDNNRLVSGSNIRKGSVLEPTLLPAFEYTRAENLDTSLVIYFDYQDQYGPVAFRLMGGENQTQMQTISFLNSGDIALQKGIQKIGSTDLYTLYRYQLKNNQNTWRYFKIRAISENGKVSPFSPVFTY